LNELEGNKQVEVEEPEDEKIPEGWTLEQFIWWLDGDIPEGWTQEQWKLYQEECEYLREKYDSEIRNTNENLIQETNE
jgi:hypothetical protein